MLSGQFLGGDVAAHPVEKGVRDLEGHGGRHGYEFVCIRRICKGAFELPEESCFADTDDE